MGAVERRAGLFCGRCTGLGSGRGGFWSPAAVSLSSWFQQNLPFSRPSSSRLGAPARVSCAWQSGAAGARVSEQWVVACTLRRAPWRALTPFGDALCLRLLTAGSCVSCLDFSSGGESCRLCFEMGGDE